MKDLKKITFQNLPPAVVSVLAEQLAAVDGIDIARDSMTPDLVVTAAPVAVAGCPVLVLPPSPVRMGDMLRRIAQMLAQPALYLDDVDLGSCVFRPQEKTVQRGADDIALTDREVAILAYLLRHHGRAVSRDELLENVWQYHKDVDSHTLETHIYRLRQKIEQEADAPVLLVTVEGGYRLLLPQVQ